MIGDQSERYFKSMVRDNIIQNYPITASDITHAHTMFVPNFTGTRGKTVRQKTDRVVMYYVAIPNDFKNYKRF